MTVYANVDNGLSLIQSLSAKRLCILISSHVFSLSFYKTVYLGYIKNVFQQSPSKKDGGLHNEMEMPEKIDIGMLIMFI